MKGCGITMFLFGILVHNFATAGAPELTKIIIVHSYHRGFEWTDDVDAGFRETLSKTHKIKILQTHYLDAKRDPKGVEGRAQNVLSRLKKQKYDLLFVTDDDAMKTVGAHFVNSDQRLIFAGINRSPGDYGFVKGSTEADWKLPKNTAGVLEFYPIGPLLELVRKIHPQASRLNLFFDESETSKAVRARFENEFNDSNVKKYGFEINEKVVSNDQKIWSDALARSRRETDINLIFPFSNVGKNSKLSPAEWAEWITKKSRALEFATASLTMKFPFFATVGIRGREHGEDAAAQAKMLLNGEPGNPLIIGKYARLNINLERAQELKVQVPFDIMAYSHSLKNTERFKEAR